MRRAPSSSSVKTTSSPRGGGVSHAQQPYESVEHTLSQMARLVDTYAYTPAVRQRANAITERVDVMRADEVAYAVWHWVRDNVRYVPDPANVELLQSPDYTIRHGYADCDGMSVLSASMLAAVGVPVAFRAVAQRQKGAYDHVYVVYQTRAGEWHKLDATWPYEPGPDTAAATMESVLDHPVTHQPHSTAPTDMATTNEFLPTPFESLERGMSAPDEESPRAQVQRGRMIARQYKRNAGMNGLANEQKRFNSWPEFFGFLIEMGPEYINALKQNEVDNFEPGQPVNLPSPDEVQSSSMSSLRSMALPIVGTAIVAGGVVYLATQ